VVHDQAPRRYRTCAVQESLARQLGHEGRRASHGSSARGCATAAEASRQEARRRGRRVGVGLESARTRSEIVRGCGLYNANAGPGEDGSLASWLADTHQSHEKSQRPCHQARASYVQAPTRHGARKNRHLCRALHPAPQTIGGGGCDRPNAQLTLSAAPRHTAAAVGVAYPSAHTNATRTATCTSSPPAVRSLRTVAS